MIGRFISDIRRFCRYSVVSAAAQLKAEVAGAFLNRLWWVLEPLCFMGLYAFVFGDLFGSRQRYFPVFVFIGLTVWDFFSRSLTTSVKIIKNNKSVVTRVYFPKYILLLTKLWVNGFKMLICFGITAVMMALYRVELTWNALFFFPVLLALGLLSFGCGCFLLHFGVYVEDLSNVVAIGLRVMFYLTGVFYSVESRIPLWGGLLNRYNPIAFLMTSLRDCLLYGRMPEAGTLLLWLGVGVLLSAAGVRTIYREENSYVKWI